MSLPRTARQDRDTGQRPAGAAARAVLLAALGGMLAGLAGGGCDWFYGVERELPYTIGHAFGTGGPGDDRGFGVAIDPAGAILVAGQLGATAQFGTTALTSNGGSDAFVAKFDPAGKPLWAVSAGGAGDDGACAVAVDRTGAVYVAGHVSAEADFGPAGKVTPYTAGSTAALSTLFLARVSLDGKVLWVRRLAATGASDGAARRVDLALDPSGDLRVAGSFITTTDLGPTPLAARGAEDLFVAKVSAGGVVQWVTAAGGAGTDRANGVVVGQHDDTSITGFFEGVAQFSGGGPKLTSAGGRDLLVARLDAKGKVLWARAAGGSGHDAGHAVTLDTGNHVVVTGETWSTDAAFGEAGKLSTAGESDLVVARLSGEGTFRWAVRGGGVGEDVGLGVAVNSHDGILVTGSFEEAPTFGAIRLTARGRRDLLVARLDRDGTFDAVAPAGGSAAHTVGWDAAVGPGDAVAITGHFDRTLEYGGATLTSQGEADVLMLVIKPRTVPEAAPTPGDLGTGSDGQVVPDRGSDGSTKPDAPRPDAARPDTMSRDGPAGDAATAADATAADATAQDATVPDATGADAALAGDAATGVDAAGDAAGPDLAPADAAPAH